jgi:hypothetical protein
VIWKNYFKVKKPTLAWVFCLRGFKIKKGLSQIIGSENALMPKCSQVFRPDKRSTGSNFPCSPVPTPENPPYPSNVY